MFYELAIAVLQSAKYAGDPFYKFVCVVALAQQHRWSDANLRRWAGILMLDRHVRAGLGGVIK